MKNLFASTRNKIIAGVIGVLVVILGALIGVFVYYQSHAMPSTTIGDLAVGGMTKEQVTASVTEAAAAQQVTLKTEGTSETMALSQAGLTLDVQKTVDQAFATDNSLGRFMSGFSGGSEYSGLYTADDAAIEKTATSVDLPEGRAAVDAAVAYSADSQSFVVTEAVSGESYDAAALSQELQANAGQLASFEVTLTTIVREPVVGTETAKAAAATATQWLGTEIYADDGEDFTQSPDINTKGSWVTFTAADGVLTPSIKAEVVQTWVDAAALETNIAPTVGLRNVDSSGAVKATARNAVDGWKANNGAAITKSIVDGMAAAAPIRATFTYETDVATWEDRPVVAGAEGLVYQPAAGEKWIDTNLSEATVTAYEGATVVAGPYYMVPGAPATPTIEGEFNVYLKYEVQTMRGENVDGTKYETPDVPWVTYFEGGYGFHGAPWRSSFGWNGPGGSHGCVNMQVDAAKFIYDWSDMGDKVISHY